MNRFLIVGVGSIGQKHIKCLQLLGEKTIASLRTKMGSLKELPSDIKSSILEFNKLQDALNWEPTHVIISNPTKLHLKTTLSFLKYNVKILVEKPFISNYSELAISEFNQLVKHDGMVGYNLRFNAIFQFIKSCVEEYGNIWRAELMVGHYLPFWHSYENYQHSYAASKMLGGGVLRTLSHEIDLCQFLFGDYISVLARVNKSSNLKIDVEDNVDILLSCNRCESIYIHLDYLNPLPYRTGKIYFERGLLEYDYFAGQIYFIDYLDVKRTKVFESKDSINNQYIRQLESFISRDKGYACSFKEGLKVDQIIELCEISSEKKQELCLV